MIPKKIHYFWFGGKPKPALIEKCIESWKKYCPDYEIIEWNESNFDVNFCPYAAKAYRQKKYAYLTDVARLQVIYIYGGIYMDTDVELLDRIDHLLDYQAWFSYMTRKFEDGYIVTQVNTGNGFGAIAGNPFIKKMLELYMTFDEDRPFEVCNQIDTAFFEKEWKCYKRNVSEVQEYDGMIIINDIWRYAFHHCVNSWLPWYKKAKNRVTITLKKFFIKK